MAEKERAVFELPPLPERGSEYSSLGLVKGRNPDPGLITKRQPVSLPPLPGPPQKNLVRLSLPAVKQVDCDSYVEFPDALSDNPNDPAYNLQSVGLIKYLPMNTLILNGLATVTEFKRMTPEVWNQQFGLNERRTAKLFKFLPRFDTIVKECKF